MPTFEVFLVSLQLRGQQAAQGPQAAQGRRHRVVIVHIGVFLTVPTGRTAAGGQNWVRMEEDLKDTRKERLADVVSMETVPCVDLGVDLGCGGERRDVVGVFLSELGQLGERERRHGVNVLQSKQSLSCRPRPRLQATPLLMLPLPA